MKGLSFKKEPHPTGLAGISNPFDKFIVKWQKKQCGIIYYDTNNACFPNGTSKWKIRLAVKEENKFHWIFFKKLFNSHEDAKTWLHENWEKIMKQYPIHQFED